MEILSKSLEETKILAEEILGDISKIPEEKGRSNILCLYGNLGAGKTAFCQILGKSLGVKERMQSPTFLIQKSYKTKNKIFKKFVHIDAYRIEDPKEMLSLGWKELLKEKNTLIAIEWSEKIEKILPKDVFKIYFEFVDKKTRKITFNL